MATIKDPLIGKEIKDYRFTDKLGGGAFGAVYRAEHTRLQKSFAIKVLHPHIASDEGIVERFRREAKSLATLNHPNIVQIVDFDFNPEFGFYLILEWIKGDPLSRMIKQQKRLSLDTVVDLFSQMLSALSEAHEYGIVHRDLKPANLMITPTGRRNVLKILDFGIASLGDDDHGLTMTGTAMGSANYMSPEQALGNIRDIDTRSDLYSCGIILGKCLTGTNVFKAESPTQILWKHIYDPAPTLASLYPEGRFSPELEAVFAKSLAKQKDDRFPDALTFLEALQDAAAAPAPSVSARTRTPAPQHSVGAHVRTPATGMISPSTRGDISHSGTGLRTPSQVGTRVPTGTLQRPITRSKSGGYSRVGNRASSGALRGIRPTKIRDANMGEQSEPSFSASSSNSSMRKPPPQRMASMGALKTSTPEPESSNPWQKYAIVAGVVFFALIGFFVFGNRDKPKNNKPTVSRTDDDDMGGLDLIRDVQEEQKRKAAAKRKKEQAALKAAQEEENKAKEKDNKKVAPRPVVRKVRRRTVRKVRKRRIRKAVRRRVVRRRVVRRRVVAKATFYTLKVRSIPSGASISKNGVSLGRLTPTTLRIRAGSTVRIRLTKCERMARSFSWSATKNASRSVRLPTDLLRRNRCP
tara:strand:- start:3557 stop:5470 length:1914 start_codon:yes stop_codon:yes gene_type:complete